MEIRHIKTPSKVDWSAAPAIIEAACTELGLVQGLRGSLAKYPGAIHWHYKMPAQAGTLEITVSESRHEIWISVQSGRRAEWIPDKVAQIVAMVEARLGEIECDIPKIDDIPVQEYRRF